jgi:hypothetical protein
VVVDDTHPQVRRAQFERLRQMTIDQRIAMAEDLSDMTTHLSRQAIREAMPDASEQHVILRWIELVYGHEIAERVAPLVHRLGRSTSGP